MMPDAEARVMRATLAVLIAALADQAPGGRDAFLVRLQEKVDTTLFPIKPAGGVAVRTAGFVRRALCDLIALARRVPPVN